MSRPTEVIVHTADNAVWYFWGDEEDFDDAVRSTFSIEVTSRPDPDAPRWWIMPSQVVAWRKVR